MKTLVVTLLLCLPLYAADKQWNTGTLLVANSRTEKATGFLNSVAARTIYTVQIDAGDRIYYATHTWDYEFLNLPKVTQNGPILWLLKDKDDLLIKDDKGKQFPLTITRTAMKDSAPSQTTPPSATPALQPATSNPQPKAQAQ